MKFHPFSPHFLAQKDQEIKSKSTRLAVAAFEFGAFYSGSTFSFKLEWKNVKVILPNSDNSWMQRKAPTTLLLNPDQSFCAFGYKAEDFYAKIAQQDSQSDNESNTFTKESCSDYYYFEKFTLFLHEKDVSKINIKLRSVLVVKNIPVCRCYKSVNLHVYIYQKF